MLKLRPSTLVLAMIVVCSFGASSHNFNKNFPWFVNYRVLMESVKVLTCKIIFLHLYDFHLQLRPSLTKYPRPPYDEVVKRHPFSKKIIYQMLCFGS